MSFNYAFFIAAITTSSSAWTAFQAGRVEISFHHLKNDVNTFYTKTKHRDSDLATFGLFGSSKFTKGAPGCSCKAALEPMGKWKRSARVSS